jgi:general stress protein YciG
MAEDRSKTGGPYMIQDQDHMSEVGQMGGAARSGGSRQSEQSQSDSRQQGGGQQGGQRSRKRTKFL